jgi:hypothetical protein
MGARSSGVRRKLEAVTFIPSCDMVTAMCRGRAGLAILWLAGWCLPAGVAAAGRGVSVDYKAPAGGRGGLEGTVQIGRAHV